MVTANDIREMVRTGKLTPSADDIVASGNLLSAKSGGHVAYQLHHGWDPAKAHLCDKTWGAFNIQIMRFIETKNYDEKALEKVLSGVQVDDGHWRWLEKSLYYVGSEYDWFYLMAEGYPQGACLIYHPKPSAIATGNIFYVEYLAAAPWNRQNPMKDRALKGVATVLLRHALNYGRNVLKLRYGFSLHALPKAAPVYRAIGMVSHAASDKPNLPYFEMPEATASEFAVA